MKKSAKMMLAFLAGAMAIASCSKDDYMVNNDQDAAHIFLGSQANNQDYAEGRKGSVDSIEWVQLWAGGPKWATTNIGAKNETDCGTYFAWGTTSSGSVENTIYNIKHSKYDVATMYYGPNWAMPSENDFRGLKDNCIIEDYGTYVRFTGRGDYSNCSIVLPKGGYKNNIIGNDVMEKDVDCHYWTSTPSSGLEYCAVKFKYNQKTKFNLVPQVIAIDDYNYECTIRPILYNYKDFDGEGTAEAPYVIKTVEGLKSLALKVEKEYDKYGSAHYTLLDDIDCEGMTLMVIGYDTTPFNGVFDGQNHTIKNFTTGSAGGTTACSSLFGYVKGATIKDLNLEVNGFDLYHVKTTAKDYEFSVSPLVGVAYDKANTYTTIKNCQVSAYQKELLDIDFDSSKDMNYGGIVGTANSNVLVRNCTNNIYINIAAAYTTSNKDCTVGGIVGKAADISNNMYCKIDRCRNTNKLYLKGNQHLHAGGILGYAYDGHANVCTFITNCVNEDDVFIYNNNVYSDNHAGGIIGCHDSDGWGDVDPVIFNCLNRGTLRGHSVGGIVGKGYDKDLKIDNCAITGWIDGKTEDDYMRLYYSDEIYVYNRAATYNNVRQKLFYNGKYFYGSNMSTSGSIYNLPEDMRSVCKWTGAWKGSDNANSDYPVIDIIIDNYVE